MFKHIRDTINVLVILALAVVIGGIAYAVRPEIDESVFEPCNEPNCHCRYAREANWNEEELDAFQRMEDQ